MRLEVLKDKLSQFLELKQVQEIIETTDKEKLSLEVEFEEGQISHFTGTSETIKLIEYIILSINVEKKQGYSGYRKKYLND